MTWVLWFLAGGTILASVLGLPKLWLGTEPLLEQFLAPSMAISNAFQHEPRVHGHGIEWFMMLLSVAIGVTGILFARFWYKDLSKTEERLAIIKQRWNGIHTLVFNKYYVDELYQATVVRATVAFSRALSWIDSRIVDGLVNATSYILRALAAVGGAIDRVIVDGAVNGVADTIIATGRRLRRVQTGRVNTYVMGVAFGVVVILLLVWFIGPQG
jgi:NADH-quinone oxidoreductase subunit L